MLRLNKEWYNPLWFILNDIIKDNNIRTVLVYGGKSSSKTVSICQILAKEAVRSAANTLAFRKESTIIPTTLKKSFNLAFETQHLSPLVDIQDRKYNVISSKGYNSEIVLKGLDKEEKAKGVESYKYIYLDELNHFTASEYNQFNLSLRGIEGQKLFAAWNPVDENSWVKTDLIDKIEFVESDRWSLPSEQSFVKISTDGKTVLIRTMYEDNYWITGSPCGTYGYRDENLINEYTQLAFKDANSYKVNVLGEWGKTTYGGEFFGQWKSETHTGNYNYDKNLAIYLCFDENTSPYFPCAMFQIQDDNKSCYLVDEIAMKHPNNNVDAMCREIARKLQAYGHKGEVYVLGDATSQKDDVKQEKGHDLFRLICNGLAEYKPRRKVGESNPSVITSKQFINNILQSNINSLKIGVNVKCRTAILDFENTKEDKNGKVDKTTKRDPVTKVTYQPYGHYCDILRYMMCTGFSREYEEYQRGGKAALPTIGKNSSNNRY